MGQAHRLESMKQLFSKRYRFLELASIRPHVKYTCWKAKLSNNIIGYTSSCQAFAPTIASNLEAGKSGKLSVRSLIAAI